MSTTTNSFTTGSLTFGSVPPTSTNQFDDDTYVVTSDGTSTGTPTAIYKFDAETSVWVLMPTGGANDFWRATVGDTLPDGVTDVTEGIYHDGVIHIGNANINAITRFSHLGIVSYTGNGTFTTQTIQTNIPANSTIMPTIYVKGYAYEAGNTIDLQLGFYTYNVPLDSIFQPVWSSSGSTKPTQVRMAYIGGLLAIELVWATTNDYFQRYEVSAYCDGWGATNVDAFFEGWTISNTPIPVTATTITVIPDKTAFSTVICPAPMTRAELIALRTAGGLVKDCDYVVTDFVQGRLLAGTLLHFQAVDASTLSMNVEVKTLFDNVGWAGIYDIDANRFIELRDSIGNIVRDSTSTRVTAFDWGNPAYTRCYFEDATVTYTYGLTAITTGLRSIASTVNLSGRTSGQIVDVDVVASALNVSASGASFTQTSITNQANVTTAGTPALSAINNTKISGSTLTVSASTNQIANISFASFGEQSVVTHDSTIGSMSIVSSSLSQSSISHTGGVFTATGLQMRGGSLSQTAGGTGVFSLTRVAVDSNASVSVSGANNVTLQNSTFQTSASFAFAGSGTASVTGSVISSSATNTISAGIAAILTISNSTISNRTAISSTIAGNTNFDRVELTGGSTVTRSGTGTLSIVSSKADSGGIILLQNVANFTVNQSSVSNNATLTSTATALSTNTCRWSRINMRSRVSFGHTTTQNCFFNYVLVQGEVSVLQTFGASGGCYIENVSLISSNMSISGTAYINVSSIVVSNTSAVNLSSTVPLTLARSRIDNLSTLNSNQTATVVGAMQQICLMNSSTYNASGNTGCNNLFVYNGSTFNHTGGLVDGLTKSMGGTLTSAFNQTNIYHNTNISQTLTVFNSNRGRDLFNNNLV